MSGYPTSLRRKSSGSGHSISSLDTKNRVPPRKSEDNSSTSSARTESEEVKRLHQLGVAAYLQDVTTLLLENRPEVHPGASKSFLTHLDCASILIESVRVHG